MGPLISSYALTVSSQINPLDPSLLNQHPVLIQTGLIFQSHLERRVSNRYKRDCSSSTPQQNPFTTQLPHAPAHVSISFACSAAESFILLDAMRAYPDRDGLPLWLFVLVILIATFSVAIVSFVLWRKCIKRHRRQVSVSSSGSDLPARKVSVKKGRIVRASWNVSLTGPRFGSASSPETNRQARQWPRPVSAELSPRSQDHESFEYFKQEASRKNENPSFLTRPWSGLSRKPTASTKRSLSFSRNRRSFRPSYISESAATEPEIYEKGPQATVTEIQPISWLDSPRPFSPIAPLTLPRISCDVPPPTSSFLKSPDRLSPHSAVPPKPLRTYQISRQDDIFCAKPRRHQRNSSTLDPGWPIPDLEAQQQQRSSAASNRSFLQEWSSVYYRWLARPSSPAVRESVNFSRRINSRPSTVVQPKIEDDVVSLPSLSPMTYDDPPSPMSTTYSEKYPSRWHGGDRMSAASKSRRGRDMSWLAGR